MVRDSVEDVANVVCVPFEGIVTVRTPVFEIAALIALVYVAKIVGVKPPDENEVALNHPVIVKLDAPGHGTAIVNDAVLFPEVLLKNALYAPTIPVPYVNVPVGVTVRLIPD